jgi:hypothetical protein
MRTLTAPSSLRIRLEKPFIREMLVHALPMAAQHPAIKRKFANCGDVFQLDADNLTFSDRFFSRFVVTILINFILMMPNVDYAD